MDTQWQHLRARGETGLIADKMVTAAREYLDTPFRHQGRLVGVGVDCAGVVVHAVRSCGVDVKDVVGYGPTPNKGLLEQSLEGHLALIKVNKTEMTAGDILLMRFVREPQHLAVFTGDGIVHAYEAAGKCCEHGLDEAWRSRIVQVYRVMG